MNIGYIGVKLNTYASENRRNATPSELLMIEILRDIGVNFSFQYPIKTKGNGWIMADFYLIDHKWVVEVDGGYHRKKKQKRKDGHRTDSLKSLKIRVMRFKNDEIEKTPYRVKDKICQLIHLNPSTKSAKNLQPYYVPAS